MLNTLEMPPKVQKEVAVGKKNCNFIMFASVALVALVMFFLMATPTVVITHHADDSVQIDAPIEIWDHIFEELKKINYPDEEQNIYLLLQKAKTQTLSLVEATRLFQWLEANEEVLDRFMTDVLKELSFGKIKYLAELNSLVEAIYLTEEGSYRFDFWLNAGWFSMDRHSLFDRAYMNLHKTEIHRLDKSENRIDIYFQEKMLNPGELEMYSVQLKYDPSEKIWEYRIFQNRSGLEMPIQMFDQIFGDAVETHLPSYN